MEPILYFFIISEHLPKPHQISEGLGFEPLELEITFPKMNGKNFQKWPFSGPQYKKGGKGQGEVGVQKPRISPWDTKYEIGVPDLLFP